MNNKKKTTLKNIILTGSIVAGSMLTINALNATETFKYSELGSGGELRSELLNDNVSDYRALDLECGEEAKTKDAKCGEGKCGEKKADATKTDVKADVKSADMKAKDGKVKAAKAGEAKMKDAKCGEGKCGEGKCGEKDVEKKAADKKKDKDGDGQPTI